MGFGLRHAKRLALGLFATCLLTIPIVRTGRTETVLPLILVGFTAGLFALVCQLAELETAEFDDDQPGS